MGGISADLVDDLFSTGLLKPPDQYQETKELSRAAKAMKKEDPDYIPLDTDYNYYKVWDEHCIIRRQKDPEETPFTDDSAGVHSYGNVGFQVDPETTSVNTYQKNGSPQGRWLPTLHLNFHWEVLAGGYAKAAEIKQSRRFFETRDNVKLATQLMNALGFTDTLVKRTFTDDNQWPGDALVGMPVVVTIKQGPDWTGEIKDTIIGFKKP